MKTKLSRRAALAGAISLAPAAAVAAVPIGADADAELIAVGEQLIAVCERARELWDFLAPYSEEFNKRLAAACEEIGGVRQSGSSKAADELWAVRSAEINQAMQAMGPELNAANDEHGRMIAAMGEPARRIFALPARTIRGLAIKAVLAAYENSDLWDEPFDDLDYNQNWLRNLIEAVLAFAGRPLPFAAPEAISNESVALAGPALAPTAALAATTAEADPIFAAIEHHRAVWEAANEPGPEDVPEVAIRALDAAEDALAATTATTVAGSFALLRYGMKVSDAGDCLSVRLLPAIERSLAGLAGERTGDQVAL